jgi:AraC-like DNA-binding protein/quercetin dioxygenase-like cupin family protein
MQVSFEAVPKSADKSFGVFRFAGKAFKAPYHYHPEIEITHIVSGRGDLIVGDFLGHFQPGDLIIQGPNLPHSYRCRRGGPAVACYAQFREDAFGPGFWDLSECRRIRGLLRKAQRGLRFSPRTAKLLGARLEALFHTGGVARITDLLTLLEDAARDTAARPLATAGQTLARPLKTSAKVESILRAIDRSWREPLRLSDIARAVRMHPQSLSRFCRRQLRRSFQEMLTEKRLGEAARRLLESDDGVAETAFACGFNNLSNFNRLFRRTYGLSPTAYRRRAEE